MTTFWAATFWICLTVLIVCIFVLGAWLVESANKEEGGNAMPRKKTPRKRGTYRRRHESDTWHFEPTCRWFPKGGKKMWVSSVSRPKHGEMCNNCKRIEDSRP